MSESTGRGTLLEKHRWLVFVLPFAVFMLVGSLEPTPETPGGAILGADIPYAYYPWVYTAKIALTVLAVVFVLGGYRPFPLRVSPLAVLVGVVGVVVWIGLCELGLEKMLLEPLGRLLEPLGLGGLVDFGARSGYDPFVALADNPAWAWGFLAIRFFGLVVVVALIEEFFLRGFLMRFVMQRDWWDIPFGKVNATAVLVAAAYGMMTHPAELLAAAVWFLMVTWLMVKTRNIWDCVVAHAVTNLLLGIYVVTTDKWEYM